MKIYNVTQGSSEWLALRAGIPTASQFDKIVTPSGKESSQAETYRYRLLAERIMGHPVAETASGWMDRGNAIEPNAIASYEFAYDAETVPVGFITNDEGTIGASPDRLVCDDGLLEIKSPSEAVHMAYVDESSEAYKAYKVQVQGQLWICEREWTDLLSFHPELPPALVRIPRDDAFIDKMRAIMTSFVAILEEKAALYEKRGWMKETVRPPQDIVQAMRDSLASLKK